MSKRLRRMLQGMNEERSKTFKSKRKVKLSKTGEEKENCENERREK